MRNLLHSHYRLTSPLHRTPASWKLVAAAGIVVMTVAVPAPSWIQFAVTGLILIVAAAMSRVPAAFLIGRLLLLEPFVVGVALLSLLSPGGVATFLSILTKSTICLLTMLLLSSTTPFAELLTVLKRAGIPAALVSTLMLMYRYLFVLIDEAERMRTARQSRTFLVARRRTWLSVSSIIGHLFVRSMSRAERVYQAMNARGWQ
jgi:cobalt/nickel transport system permease protein